MANLVYNVFKLNLLDAEADFSGDTAQTYNIMLLTSSYTPDADHLTVDDVDANEIAGTGYDDFVAGNLELANLEATQDDTDNEGVLDNTVDSTWAGSTITARYAVIYRYVDATPSNCPLVCLIDFGSDKSSSSGDFTIQWNAEGIINLN